MDAVKTTLAKQMTERDWWQMRAKGAGTVRLPIGSHISDAEMAWIEMDLRGRRSIIAKAILNV